MPRVKRGPLRRRRRAKLLARAKGFFQTKSKLHRAAKEAVDTSLNYAFIGRKLRKRDFRRLWITRIGAATRQHGLSYSQFMHGLKTAGIGLDRKALADLAVREPDAFAHLVEQARSARESTAAAS